MISIKFLKRVSFMFYKILIISNDYKYLSLNFKTFNKINKYF